MDATIQAAALAEAGHMVEPVDVEELIAAGEAEPIHARDLLLELAAIAAERDQVKSLMGAVLDRYKHKLDQLTDRETVCRSALEQYILQVNDGEKVAIPDAGTAYLTTKNKGGKLTIADEEALLTFLRRRFPQIVEAATVSTVKVNDALALAADELDIIPTADGKVITTAGEVVELPGIGAEPESKTLAVRAA